MNRTPYRYRIVPTTPASASDRLGPSRWVARVVRKSGCGILGMRRHDGGCTFRSDDVARRPINRCFATLIISCCCTPSVFYGSPAAAGRLIGSIMPAVWGVDGERKYPSAEMAYGAAIIPAGRPPKGTDFTSTMLRLHPYVLGRRRWGGDEI